MIKSGFIKQYELFQNTPKRIRDEDENRFFELFNPAVDLDSLLKSVGDYDLHTDYIKIDNFLNIMKNTVIVDKLTIQDKKKVAAFLYTKITQSDKNAKLIRYRLHVLLHTYTKDISVVDVEKLFDEEWIRMILPSAFMYYFRINKERDLYRAALTLEIKKKPDKGEMKYIVFNEEDILYIKTEPKLSNKFVDFLVKNIAEGASLLNQLSYKPYIKQKKNVRIYGSYKELYSSTN